jgi:hypothetical protein
MKTREAAILGGSRFFGFLSEPFSRMSANVDSLEVQREINGLPQRLTDGDENGFFVARASRRAASTVVSTLLPAVTAICLEAPCEINPIPYFQQSGHVSTC